MKKKRRKTRKGMSALPLPPDIPRPEMWDVEGVVRAVHDGFAFMLPLRISKGYWIGGVKFDATGLTVGPAHTPDIIVGEDGWLRVRTFFRPEMVPERAWLEPPSESGVVPVYVEIEPEAILWDALNRGHQSWGRFP